MDTLFEKMNQLKVLVIGDVMIDAYLIGDTNRISPEAPVPVVHIKQKEMRLGGAANVALNCVALGAQVSMLGLVGKDDAGKKLKELLLNDGITVDGIVTSETKPTTVKTRVVSHGQQLLRTDEEDTSPINKETEDKVIAKFNELISSSAYNLVIFEDYNKGLLTPRVISALCKTSDEKGIPTVVDPKKDNFFAYQNVSLFKPNLKELREGLEISVDPSSLSSLEEACTILQEKIKAKAVFTTLSEYGVYYHNQEYKNITAAHKRKIADVSGAGDSVIAVAGIALALGMSPKDIAELANIAGGLVCEEPGVVPINKQMLLTEAKKLMSKSLC